jgi:hypothetical protein
MPKRMEVGPPTGCNAGDTRIPNRAVGLEDTRYERVRST